MVTNGHNKTRVEVFYTHYSFIFKRLISGFFVFRIVRRYIDPVLEVLLYIILVKLNYVSYLAKNEFEFYQNIILQGRTIILCVSNLLVDLVTELTFIFEI